MKKVIILGCGLVGGPMALDLAADDAFEVTVADLDREKLGRIASKGKLQTLVKDLSDPAEVEALVYPYDLVISAVPGFMGYRTLEAIIHAGKNVVDIAFFPEDARGLDSLAREKGVVAVMDCGVAPGMCNILIGYAASLLDEVGDVAYYVGGLPVVRTWPWEYKAVFSPVDVIEEYTRPARLVENGNITVKPALSDPERMDFKGIGTLEAFNSDGLRSLTHTVRARNMKEKTLRYPGHIGIMAVLRETGFFSKEPVNIKGHRISPLDLTAKLLFPAWQLHEGEEDITVMKVTVEGRKDGKPVKYEWDLFDRYDPSSGIHSMARTTGYTATVALRMIAEGIYSRTGLSYPEYIGQSPECVEYMLKGLKQRGVLYTKRHS